MGYKRAEGILTEHMDKLHALAEILLEREKLDAEEFKAFMETGAVPEKPASPAPRAPQVPKAPEAPQDAPAPEAPVSPNGAINPEV